MDDESTTTVRLPEAAARRFGHVCGFFRNREEEYRVLLPLAKEGFQRGEKLFHVVDPEHRLERMRRLEEVGISPDAARRSGQVEIRGWEDAHVRGGRFDQEAMMTLLEETLRGAKADGFGMTRVWANMEWALGEFPGVEDLVEYEIRVNYFLPRYDDLVVCTYDVTKFGAGIMMDVLRTHPLVIIGGFLQENPFFVPPDELLVELRARDGATPQN
ncbi:MAG TPA: MEDS domain-containing protein [Planctomycetota bacterium]|nr:MEDS domain-containing protein [Planctomycetota bacterium]